MSKAKVNKMLITVLCFAMMISMSATVFAAGTKIGPITVNPDTNSNGTNTAQTIGNKVIGIIQVVGIIMSVGILMILGIKYMMGSAEEKAEYKKTFIPYIIGALLLFAASAFAQMIYQFASGVTA